MIVATLGTHHQPMDRVVVALDALLENGAVDDEVVVQAAAFRRRPLLAKQVGVLPFDELVGLLERARAVITHGGPGSILLAQAYGHRPLVVPRDPALGEHVDDHQQRFVRWLAPRGALVPVWDVARLAELLAAARRGDDRATRFGAGASAVARRLDELVRDGRGRRS